MCKIAYFLIHNIVVLSFKVLNTEETSAACQETVKLLWTCWISLKFELSLIYFFFPLTLVLLELTTGFIPNSAMLIMKTLIMMMISWTGAAYVDLSLGGGLQPACHKKFRFSGSAWKSYYKLWLFGFFFSAHVQQVSCCQMLHRVKTPRASRRAIRANGQRVTGGERQTRRRRGSTLSRLHLCKYARGLAELSFLEDQLAG